MNRQENAVNDNLCALDEAYRLGHITRDEYRARRRCVLRCLSDGGGIASDAITRQGSIIDARSLGGNRPAADADAPQRMSRGRAPRVWNVLVGLVVLVVVTALVWYLWSSRG